MAAVDDFLRSTLPALEAADTAFHDGDPRERSRTWSHHDPVTLFGAVFTETGWAELEGVFPGWPPSSPAASRSGTR